MKAKVVGKINLSKHVVTRKPDSVRRKRPYTGSPLTHNPFRDALKGVRVGR